MSINSFRKPFTVAASAVLLSSAGGGVAQAAARPPARWSVPAAGFKGPATGDRAALARQLGVTPGQLDAVMRGSRTQLATTRAARSTAAAGATGAAGTTA